MKTFPLLALSILVFACARGQSPETYEKFSFQKPEMGSLFSIVLYAEKREGAALAAERAFHLVDSLNNIFSDYLDNSELNRLCQRAGTGEWVPVSAPLYNILTRSVAAAQLSKGTFDITSAPVIKLWREARKNRRLPNKKSLDQARALTGYRLIQFDSLHTSVRLQKKGMQLDLGGIAKGETAQQVIDYLASIGYPYALIDAGGDIVAGKVPAGSGCWRVGMNSPGSDATLEKRLCLTEVAVTTSGDYYQYLQIGQRRYSHIIDPRTGNALTSSRNVTVISPRGIDADWLTKACSVLPIARCMQLIASFPNTEVQIGILGKDKPIFYRSPGFNRWLED